MSNIIHMKDPQEYESTISELKRKLNMMSEQVQVYERRVNGLAAEKDLLTRKLASAAKDSENIRNIMTNNIQQSNIRIQSLLEENQALRKKIKESD